MKIGIISLGLIGGSLFKALCSYSSYTIFGVTRNKNTIKEAKNYTKYVSDNMSIVSECDIVFVAAPINKTVEILDKLEGIVTKNCIVLDCASVKEFVMKKERPYKFIGSHPMAGTEFSGFDASYKELFEGAKWVLTPSFNVEKGDIDKVKQIISMTGAKTIITDAKEHEYAVALISHMPLLLSQAIFKCASDNNLALKLASSGFRDMTRLAMSNIEMANDMFLFNSSNIQKALDKLSIETNFLKKTKDLKIFTDIKNNRSNMYSKEGKNIL